MHKKMSLDLFPLFLDCIAPATNSDFSTANTFLLSPADHHQLETSLQTFKGQPDRTHTIPNMRRDKMKGPLYKSSKLKFHVLTLYLNQNRLLLFFYALRQGLM